MTERPDTIDLGEVAAAIRRGWRQVALGVAVGALAAVAVLLFARRKYDGTATVLLRSNQEAGGSLASRLGIPTALAPGALSGAMGASFETELEILVSRAVVGRVVDSLGLQARVLKPAGIPSDAILEPTVYPGLFPGHTYRFTRTTGGTYRVRGDGVDATVTPGGTVTLPVGPATLRPTGLPASFTVAIQDREDAITRVEKQLKTAQAAGEVARLTYRSGDSATAAAVPNAVIAVYLERRKTTDRGTNQRRVEFLLAETDTVTRRLADADARLKAFQQASGVLDPVLAAKTDVERATVLRQALGQVEVELTTLDQMLSHVRAGALTPRQLAAYPTFLKSQAINDLLSQMATLETRRLELAARRTDRDPEMQALDSSIQNLAGQLQPLATAYAGALTRQRQTLALQLDTIQRALEALPSQTQASAELERDVKALTETYLGLQVQTVDARLAAIGEGGDVRQIDVAVPPRKPAFPRPAWTLLIGLVAGLLLGLLAALKSAYLGRWVRRPEDVERAAGVPGLALEPGTPLLVGDLSGARTILVIPLGAGADAAAVAERLGAAALDRETAAAVTNVATNGAGRAGGGAGAVPAIRKLEEAHQLVIAEAPGLGDSRTAALLEPSRPVLFVARAGRLARRDLIAAVQTLRRLEIPCSGVVLHGPTANGDSGG